MLLLIMMRERQKGRDEIFYYALASHTLASNNRFSHILHTRARIRNLYACSRKIKQTTMKFSFVWMCVCVLLYNCCCFCCFFRTFNGYTERALLHVSHFSRMKYIFCSSCNLRLVLSPICIALEYCIVAFIIMGLYTYIEYNDEHTMEWEIVNGPCHTL